MKDCISGEQFGKMDQVSYTCLSFKVIFHFKAFAYKNKAHVNFLYRVLILGSFIYDKNCPYHNHYLNGKSKFIRKFIRWILYIHFQSAFLENLMTWQQCWHMLRAEWDPKPCIQHTLHQEKKKSSPWISYIWHVLSSFLAD